MSRVNIPLGGNTEVYTDQEDRKYFNYANVRKAAHRSNQESFIISVIKIHLNNILVFKFSVIWGIFLFYFFDAMFFTMLIKEEYLEPVKTHQDLIDRDMSLGYIYKI